MAYKEKIEKHSGFGKPIWSSEDYKEKLKEKEVFVKEPYGLPFELTEKDKFKEPTPEKKDKKQVFLEEIKKKDVITEREILLIKRRLNEGTYKSEDVNEIDTKKLTPEQNEKGFKYLYDLYKSPTGKERVNNPFGDREEEVLNNFSHFELVDWYDNGNQYYKNYVPVYRVVAKDGSGFEYVMKVGKIEITD